MEEIIDRLPFTHFHVYDEQMNHLTRHDSIGDLTRDKLTMLSLSDNIIGFTLSRAIGYDMYSSLGVIYRSGNLVWCVYTPGADYTLPGQEEYVIFNIDPLLIRGSLDINRSHYITEIMERFFS